MRSASAGRTSRRARRAADSPVAHAIARVGLSARGVIYILMGLVAFLVAIGHSRREADQEGALQLLAGKPYGMVALWLLALGFAAYALWRLSEAVFGVTGEGRGAGPRLKSLGRAIVYAFFAALTVEVIAGSAGSETRKQQDLTATMMQSTGGRVVVGIVGLAVAVAGLVLAWQGWRRAFMKQLRLRGLSRQARRTVELLGVIGTMARGLIFALAGVLVIEAAVTHNAAKSGGIDKALLTLRDQPFGEVLLLAAALGLLIFGVYGLCEARWREV